MPSLCLGILFYLHSMKSNQPKIIGLTGGIGSGKTTAAKYFEQLGFPLYNSDLRAKEIQNTNSEVIQAITKVFGPDAYVNGEMNRPYIASITFNDKEKLQALNAIVHPAVFQDFNEWINQQTSPYIIKEAAILIESGSYKNCDLIITVNAGIETRIERAIKRDQLQREQIEARIKNQLSDEERASYADFVLDNSKDLSHLYHQIDEIVNTLNKRV